MGRGTAPRVTGRAATRSVLVITAEPDDRGSTSSLREVVEELRRRGIRCEVWFLRARGYQTPWPGSRVADSLRTWAGTHVLQGVGLGVPAGWIRGQRLRAWLRAAAPDVVLLDDAMGERLCETLGPEVRRVARINDEPPPDEFGEHRVLHADLVVTTPDTRSELPAAPVRMTAPLPQDRRAGKALRDPRRRAEVRERLGVPLDGPLLVGWGEDAWADGADLFVRGMWTLEARTGHRPAGVWFGLAHDELERARLTAEAARCGLADRFTFVDDARSPDRYGADVLFLPMRAAADPDAVEDVDQALVAGARVVAADAAALPQPEAERVPDLDLESAATSLAAALERGRTPGLESEVDVEVWVGRLLELLAGAG